MLGRIAEIRACIPEVRLLVVSVHDDATIARAALDAGADGVVLKRALATDLLAAVDAVQQGGKYVSQGVRAPSESSPRRRGGMRA